MHLPAGRLIILDVTPTGKKVAGGRVDRGRIGLSLGDVSQAAEGCSRRMAATFLKLVTTRSQPVNLLLALSDPVTFFRRFRGWGWVRGREEDTLCIPRTDAFE